MMAVSGRATASEVRHLKASDAREASTALLVTLESVGVEIRSRLELADKALGKAEDHYRAAGLQLIDVKKRIAASGQDGDGASTFEAFLKQHSIGRSRAYDMIAIADGKKTLANVRAKAAVRAAAHANRNRTALASVSNGLPARRYRDLHPADPLNKTVEELLPDDFCARAWANRFANMPKPEGADEYTYHVLHEAFARLGHGMRMEIIKDWYSSLPRADQLKFHMSCPNPLLPGYVGDWLVEALLDGFDYRPEDEMEESERRELAFAEMEMAFEVFRKWPKEMRIEFERRQSIVDDMPAFLELSKSESIAA